MPTRYLKPGIRDSEPIDRLSPLAECLFYRLLVTVDDFGRSDARPAMIKAACFPIKEGIEAKHCAALLEELATYGLIDLYVVDGKPYLQMQKWENVPRARASKFPAPADGCAQVYTPAETLQIAHLEGSVQMRASVCNPRTLLPETETETETGTENREPETENRNRNRVATRPPKADGSRHGQSAASQAWEAYADAYAGRYAAMPVRNAKVNGQLAQLVARLGADEAPAVAAFYVGHNGAFYVRAMHAVDLLLRDAEKLRTEWATRRQVTATAALQADKTQTNLEAFGPLLAEARAREAAA